MGFRNAQQSNEQTNEAARSTTHSPATESTTQQSTPNPSMMGRIWSSVERAEEHFGIEIPDESTLQRLEINERKYGRETHDWIAEGMPADIMGSPRDMEVFRERQAERPPEVPTNIERQNRRSVLRSEKAATETKPAGKTGVPEPVRDVISSRGRSLDPSIQREMEDQMDDSFGDVRIHTGPAAAEACEAINARAFTVGNHIAFNQGEYDPSTPDGQHVLAHELAHVRQQTTGAVSMLPQEDVELEVDADPALEREAEETAQRVVEGSKLGIQQMRSTNVHVQRWKNQPRDDFGRFDEKDQKQYDEKKYGRGQRPPYAPNQVETVWKKADKEASNLPEGQVPDPFEPWRILQWDGGDRKGEWDMGHKPRREYEYLVEYYLRDIITEEEFLHEYQNPDHYHPQHPTSNRSGKYDGEGEYWAEKWGSLEGYE